MEKVEEDLRRSKSVRERQARDFSEQLDALRQKCEQQVRVLALCPPPSAGARERDPLTREILLYVGCSLFCDRGHTCPSDGAGLTPICST